MAFSSFNLQDEVKASGGSSPLLMASPLQNQSRLSRENTLCQNPSAQLVEPISNLLFTGPNPLLQDCLHKSLNSLPTTHQSSLSSTHYTCTGPSHHTSLNALHHTCQCFFPLSDSKHLNNTYFTPHFHNRSANYNRPSSGHHTCPGFLHHRDSSSSAKPEPLLKLSSRSSSYERSSILSKSASSSKAASPMPSPHASPSPSPCPSLLKLAALPCSPDHPCSPSLTKKLMVTDMSSLSADSRPQQRGTQVYVCVLSLSTSHAYKIEIKRQNYTLLVDNERNTV